MSNDGDVRRDIADVLVDHYGPDATLAYLGPLVTAARLARIDAVLAARLGSIATVVEDLYDPHNVVAAIRTTEALGLHEFHAIGGEGFRTAVGITRNCEQWIALHRWASSRTCVESLRARGFRVYATLPAATVDIETVDVGTPVALVFGNEHQGVAAETVAACDGAVTLPMFGFTESFNVSVAVALAMGRLAARRRAHVGGTGDLSVQLQHDLRARWIARSVRAPDQILARCLPAVALPARSTV